MSSAVVPSKAAILASIPSNGKFASSAPTASRVSIANTAAPSGSPTNNIPFGPNASGPADFTSGVPTFIARLAATTGAAVISTRQNVNQTLLFIAESPALEEGTGPTLPAALE